MKRINVKVSALALAIVCMLVSSVFADDWPMFHHDLALSGYTNSAAPSTDNILWTYQTNASIQSSPAIVNGKVYIGSRDGYLYCLDRNTGALIWSYYASSVIQSSPAVAEGIVYFLATNGVMHALDADDGSVVWTVNLSGGSWDWSSPAVHDQNVFIGSSSGFIYSLNALTGAVVWSTYIGAEPNSPISVVNGKVYSGTHNFDNAASTLLALDELTGAIVWTYDYHLYHGGVVGMVNCNGAAVVDGDGDGDLEVYFGVFNWNGVSNQAVCLDEATGTEVWTQNLHGSSTSTPAVHDGKLFIGSDDHNLYALDAATGAYLWNYTTGGRIWAAPAVSGDGKVCFGSLDHWVYCVDEDTGAEIWKYNTGTSRLYSSPAISDGMLVVGNENGKVYAFGCGLSITPPRGTIGTEITITGCGFGDQRGSVFIDKWKTKTLEWNDSSIVVKHVHQLSPGDYILKIVDKFGNVLNQGVFTIMASEITYIAPTAGTAGDTITIVGNYFGDEYTNLYVYLKLKWEWEKIIPYNRYMDPVTGASLCVFKIPTGLDPRVYPLYLRNLMGWSTGSVDLTVY
jgi:outer membrane protein assembly factor BamB